MEFSYRIDCATATDLEIFLKECDKYFTLTLSSRVGNISKYAMKIRINGVTFEAWLQGKLVGAIIGYFNDFESKEAYIPVVCVNKKYSNQGIASNLVKRSIAYSKENSFKSITLEVASLNIKAQSIYTKNGFEFVSTHIDKIYMKKVL